MVIPPPPNNAIAEQYIGRTHREGQQADVVTFDCMFGDEIIEKGFEQSVRDAKYVEDTYDVPQKLLLGLTTNPWLVDQALNFGE